MADPYASYEPVPLSPYGRAAAVTPNDGANLATTGRALWVGGAGAVKVDTAQGDAGILISGVPAGTLLPIRVQKVYATGTTATLILVLW